MCFDNTLEKKKRVFFTFHVSPSTLSLRWFLYFAVERLLRLIISDASKRNITMYDNKNIEYYLSSKKTVCDFARRIGVIKNNNHEKTFVGNKDQKNGMILF